MRDYKSIFIYGFALFAMFFGSGNLVFPIQIGLATGEQWFAGFVGLFLTGIALPFLGLFVIKLHRGSYLSFFAQAGPVAKVILPLFTLSLLGAFGVVPRCITVARGGMEYLAPDLSLPLFSILFCLVTFYFCLKDERMIGALGKWMSPILLISLSVLIGTGIWHDHPASQIVPTPTPLLEGFLMGYQTMDLFAAFFFSALMFSQIQKTLAPETSHQQLIRYSIKPSLLGAALLALVYLGFVYLGAHYGEVIQNVDPEYMLPSIAQFVMGDQAALFIGIAMLFSCLTTAVALNNIYARYLCQLMKLKDKQFPFVLVCTTFISFLVSLLDFKGIAAFLVPALEVSYPAIILLTIMGIMTPHWRSAKKYGFYSITGWMVMRAFL